MPIMSKMRDNMPAILIGLAILFVATIVFDWGMDITGRRSRGLNGNIVGKVNGEEITYQKFEQLLQRAVDDYKARTKQDPDDQVMSQLRDQVWDALVNQILVDQEARKLGIIVTDQEILDWVTNRPETLPDIIKKNFEDSTGHLNRQILQAALASNNPEVVQFWRNVQEYLKEQRLQDKLTGRLYSAVRIPPSELKMKFEQESIKANANYVLFDPNVLYTDSSANVTDSDVREYYSRHQNEFRTQPTRQLRYVVLPEVPSHADSVDVLNQINQAASLAKGGTDFLELVKEYSETPFSDTFVGRGQINPSIADKINDAKVGDVIGPFLAQDGYHLVKIIAEQKGKTEFVHAAHILIRIIPGPDSTLAYRQAATVLKEARNGANFAQLARQYSQDPGSAQNGGDLGWFSRGMMVKPFEDAAFKARAGQIVGPIRTQYGLHIIKVLGKDSRELKIADIKMSVKITQQTKDDLKQRGEDFIYLAKQDGFDRAAQTMNLQPRETPPFTRGNLIPGIGTNTNLINWAFKGSLGDISDVINTSQGYAVFMLTRVTDAGVRPLDQVSAQIKAKLIRERKMQMAQNYANSLLKKLGPKDSLKMLTQIDSRLVFANTGEFNPLIFVPGIGRDFNFMAQVYKLRPGQISKPFNGLRGVYIVQVLYKTPFDSTMFAVQRLTLMQQMMQEQKSRIVNDWIQHLKETASIEDNRSKFFR